MDNTRECIVAGLGLLFACFVAACFGGCDNTSDREVPVTTPHGVHGKLKGE
jgi:hypothetical protein